MTPRPFGSLTPAPSNIEPPASTSWSPPSSFGTRDIWNARVAALRQVETAPDPLLAHFSPLGSEHINLTGDYVWGAPHSVSENPAGLRLQRPVPEPFPRAA